MAIPLGTTARQLRGVARWALAAMVVLGMIAWWWPGYGRWGALVAGLGAVLLLWLAWKTVAADRTVPGHPIHLALLVPAVVLAGHFVQSQIGAGAAPPWALAGALNASMILHLALLSLGVMLAQDLLPAAARRRAVLAVCGAAMMGGPLAAMRWAPAQPVRTALALLGFAGVGVWLSTLWGLGPAAPDRQEQTPGPPNRFAGFACVPVAVAASAALAATAPLPGLLAAGIVAATLFLAGLVFPRRRAGLLVAGGGMGIGVAAVLASVRWMREALAAVWAPFLRAPWCGGGEEAFRTVSAADSGLAVLAGTVGWAPTGAFVLGLAACFVLLLLHARRGHPGDRGRAVVWTAASGMVAGALLAPGGMFLPAALLAATLVWGLLPRMLGRPVRPRPGTLLLVGVGLVLLLQAVAAEPGLLRWISQTYGLGDKALHAAMGFLLAMLLAWLLGARRGWMGAAGIALAVLAGLLGEVVQAFVSTRSADLRDWISHTLGCTAAAAPYLLCLGARHCESPDAPPVQPDALLPTR